MASGMAIALVGFAGAVTSSPMPPWTPSVLGCGVLVFAWGAVAAAPEDLRRVARIWAIVGTVWTVGCAAALTVILVRISK
jgi:hypothetical protein